MSALLGGPQVPCVKRLGHIPSSTRASHMMLATAGTACHCHQVVRRAGLSMAVRMRHAQPFPDQYAHTLARHAVTHATPARRPRPQARAQSNATAFGFGVEARRHPGHGATRRWGARRAWRTCPRMAPRPHALCAAPPSLPQQHSRDTLGVEDPSVCVCVCHLHAHIPLRSCSASPVRCVGMAPRRLQHPLCVKQTCSSRPASTQCLPWCCRPGLGASALVARARPSMAHSGKLACGFSWSESFSELILRTRS